MFPYVQPISNSLLKMGSEGGQNFFLKILLKSIPNRILFLRIHRYVPKAFRSARKALQSHLNDLYKGAKFDDILLCSALFSPISNSLLKMGSEGGQNFFLKIFQKSIPNRILFLRIHRYVPKAFRSARKALQSHLNDLYKGAKFDDIFIFSATLRAHFQ